jgi:hypothetical protein
MLLKKTKKKKKRSIGVAWCGVVRCGAVRLAVAAPGFNFESAKECRILNLTLLHASSSEGGIIFE